MYVVVSLSPFQTVASINIPPVSILNKGNSSIPLFEIHKSIEKKQKSELHTKTEGNTTNTTLRCNTHRNEL